MTLKTVNNYRRNFLKKLTYTFLISPLIPRNSILTSKNQNGKVFDINKIRKIDIHTHISSDAEYLREIMDTWNLKMFTICNEGLKSDRLEAQRNIAVDICQKYPRYYAWCTTFDLNGIQTSGWTDRVIRQLQADFDRGALAVKIWKEVGMQLKDKKGNFIQIDGPVFEPVLQFISNQKKTLFTHIGDPVEYWLSTGSDGLPDAWYKEGGGVWNRIGEFKGEVSYDSLMRARDHVILKYPDLKMVGCHFGSMAFDVDEIAKRLDAFPNFAVETSFTLPYLMSQAREKIRDFFVRYQDRILYGSDISGGMVATPYLVDMSKINERWTPEEMERLKQDLMKQYEHDFNYLATNQEFTRSHYSVHGLELPETVLQKIYYDNAVSWVPGVGKDFE
jgi:predicted TIM-barrel fold metal-dependent hydrolase